MERRKREERREPWNGGAGAPSSFLCKCCSLTGRVECTNRLPNAGCCHAKHWDILSFVAEDIQAFSGLLILVLVEFLGRHSRQVVKKVLLNVACKLPYMLGQHDGCSIGLMACGTLGTLFHNPTPKLYLPSYQWTPCRMTRP